MTPETNAALSALEDCVRMLEHLREIMKTILSPIPMNLDATMDKARKMVALLEASQREAPVAEGAVQQTVKLLQMELRALGYNLMGGELNNLAHRLASRPSVKNVSREAILSGLSKSMKDRNWPLWSDASMLVLVEMVFDLQLLAPQGTILEPIRPPTTTAITSTNPSVTNVSRERINNAIVKHLPPSLPAIPWQDIIDELVTLQLPVPAPGKAATWREFMDQAPKFGQRQDSMLEQLADLRLVANKLGFYDAADYLKEPLK